MQKDICCNIYLFRMHFNLKRIRNWMGRPKVNAVFQYTFEHMSTLHGSTVPRQRYHDVPTMIYCGKPKETKVRGRLFVIPPSLGVKFRLHHH